jgi:small subunit ribosomal protein S21
MIEVKLKKGEAVDKALRKLRKKVTKEGVLDAAREKNYYEKPNRKKYKKSKRAKYIQKLRAEQERDYWS